jgi:hypothetical protein
MIMASPPPHELLDIVDTWLEAQSSGAREPEKVLHRPPSKVILKILVSAGAKFRTSCDLPVSECHSINKLLKTTWEAVREEVEEKLPGETYKWWEGVVLIGNSSLETKKHRRMKLLGMNTEHQKTWMEWRHRNVEEGYRQVYTIGVAFGVPHCKRTLR